MNYKILLIAILMLTTIGIVSAERYVPYDNTQGYYNSFGGQYNVYQYGRQDPNFFRYNQAPNPFYQQYRYSNYDAPNARINGPNYLDLGSDWEKGYHKGYFEGYRDGDYIEVHGYEAYIEYNARFDYENDPNRRTTGYYVINYKPVTVTVNKVVTEYDTGYQAGIKAGLNDGFHGFQYKGHNRGYFEQQEHQRLYAAQYPSNYGPVIQHGYNYQNYGYKTGFGNSNTYRYHPSNFGYQGFSGTHYGYYN